MHFLQASTRSRLAYILNTIVLYFSTQPVPEELQNGDGFGYIIALRLLGELTWTHVVTSAPGRYVYRNESIAPFSPFAVKVGAYNVKGQGPFSPVTTVFSAEEGESTNCNIHITLRYRYFYLTPFILTVR